MWAAPEKTRGCSVVTTISSAFCTGVSVAAALSRIARACTSGSAAELGAHALVHDSRVGLAACLLHHLADEEAQQTVLAAAELLGLGRVRLDDPVDHRIELARVRDVLLLEVRRRG